MCVSVGTAMIISSVIGAASMAMAPKPSSPSMPPLPSMEPVKQAQKRADSSVADRIKATRSKMGNVATPKTMLAGTMGVEDETLNLGGKLI
mgnify:CR=1 FL=1